MMDLLASFWIFLNVFGLQLSGVELEKLTVEPEDATVSKGQVHIMQCTVENKVGAIQWLRNGFGLGQGTHLEGYPRYKLLDNPSIGEFPLMITNIQLEDDAFFQCQVGATQSSPGLQSRKARLDVQLPPSSVKIEGSPIVEVLLNSAHNLTCHAQDGKPAPIITWQSDSMLLTENIYYDTVTQTDGKRQDGISRLTVLPQKSDQGRSFVCFAMNPALLAPEWTSVSLNVLYLPEVTMVTTPYGPINEFESVTFSCSAISNPNVESWRWYQGDVLIEGQTSNMFVGVDFDRLMHRQNVSCEAINKVGTGRFSTTINVNYGPKFTSDAEDKAADVGSSLKVSCTIDSNPPASISWQKKDHMKILNSNSDLVISPLKEESFGVYTCTASVSGFEDITHEVRILKKGPPVIISSPEQRAKAKYGETGSMECSVKAVPRPDKIFWYRDGILLNEDTLNRFKTFERDTRDGRLSRMEISNIQESDFTEYNCTTDNGYGMTYLTVSLSKSMIIPLPHILAAVLSGSLIIILASAAIFIHHKRKTIGSELDSESSECSITKKKKVPTATLR